MQNNPLISIIIPVYNGEGYIKRSIESALAQTLRDVEVIIIDDGSTDQTSQTCSEIQDKRLRYFYKDHEGVSAARNKGLDIAHGEWIMFLDADDYLDESICRSLYSEAAAVNADFAFCNLCNIYEDGRIEKPLTFRESRIVFCEDKVRQLEHKLVANVSDTGETFLSLSGPCCKLINRESIDKIRFHEEIDIGEDTCFVLEVLNRSKTVVHISDFLYNRVIRSGSLSYNDISGKRLGRFMAWVQQTYACDVFFNNAANTLYARHLAWLTRTYIRNVPIGQLTAQVKELKTNFHDYESLLIYAPSVLDIKKSLAPKREIALAVMAKLQMYQFIWLMLKINACLKKVNTQTMKSPWSR